MPQIVPLACEPEKGHLHVILVLEVEIYTILDGEHHLAGAPQIICNWSRQSEKRLVLLQYLVHPHSTFPPRAQKHWMHFGMDALWMHFFLSRCIHFGKNESKVHKV